MPESLGIGFFVLGAVLILIALVGGKFKIFVAEISPAVTSPLIRIIAFALGVVFILLALNPTMASIALAVSANTESPAEAGIPQPDPQLTQLAPQPTQTSPQSTQVSLQPVSTYETPLPEAPNPAEFVISYWQNVNDGRFENSWVQLSPGFRQAAHSNDYNDYLRGYQEMQLCRIVISDVNVIQQDDSSAVVKAHFIYYAGSQCSSTEYNFEMWLVYDAVTRTWLLDKNFIR